MPSPLFGEDDEDWRTLGDAPDPPPPVHDVRRMQAKEDGQRLWEAVQRELRRVR